MFDMAESGRAERKDWGADLSIGDDLYAKDIGEAGSTVITKGTEDEVFTFLIEDEDTREHGSKGVVGQ